jgi:hypothetical protein
METTINTINGTYIVPADKLDQLIQWLEINAIRPGASSLREVKIGDYSPEFKGRQLINE